jgi:hypothetical protein
MWWLFTWKMGLAIAAAAFCIHYAVESGKSAREAYQAWQTTRTALEHRKDR